jgi:hypothetical protein
VAAGGEKSVAGLTAGSSFQDYRMSSVDVKRKVVFYDCCPQSPYPTLLYSVSFQVGAPPSLRSPPGLAAVVRC